MARRKKRKKRSMEQKSLKKEPEIFNPPKGDLDSLKNFNRILEKERATHKSSERKQEHNERLFFLEALSDVTPLSHKKKRVARFPDPNTKPGHPAGSDELEALAHLSDLVSGAADIDITFTDEYIEGAAPGFSRKLMERLKKGQFPVQDYVDLHGLTKQEAEVKVKDFLVQSYRLGLRCVLIVHGRGLNSEDHIPVLKERLPSWLNRRAINKIVLAFSTARPYDGGAGAVYVLLRKVKAGT